MIFPSAYFLFGWVGVMHVRRCALNFCVLHPWVKTRCSFCGAVVSTTDGDVGVGAFICPWEFIIRVVLDGHRTCIIGSVIIPYDYMNGHGWL